MGGGSTTNISSNLSSVGRSRFHRYHRKVNPRWPWVGRCRVGEGEPFDCLRGFGYDRSQHEIGNVQKCLAADFSEVILISSEKKVLTSVRHALVSVLSSAQYRQVKFFAPEELFSFLEGLEIKTPRRTVAGDPNELLTAKEVEEKAIFELRWASTHAQCIGQLVFDPNGEYANENVQDAATQATIPARSRTFGSPLPQPNSRRSATMSSRTAFLPIRTIRVGT